MLTLNNKNSPQSKKSTGLFYNKSQLFATYLGPDNRLRTKLKNFFIKVFNKILNFLKKVCNLIKKVIETVVTFILYKFFWFLIKPYFFIRRNIIHPLFLFFSIMIHMPFQMISWLFSLRYLDFFKEIWDICWVHFWFSPLMYLANKSTAVSFYKLAMGCFFIDEEYELPVMPMTFKERIYEIVREDIKKRRSQDIQTDDYFQPSKADTKAFQKLEPLLASRHRLQEELEEAREEGTFYDYYLVVEDLRKLGFEEALLKQVDFLMLLYFNDELLQHARRHLNLRSFDGDHLVTKEDLLEQLRLKPDLLEWGKGLLRNKVNIYIHMEREQRERKEEQKLLRAKREEVVRRTNPFIGKLYLIFIALLDSMGRREDDELLDNEQFEEEQDREDGIEEVVNYDFWTFIEVNSFYNFMHRLRLFRGPLYIRRFQQFLYLLSIVLVFFFFYIAMYGFAIICIELYIEFEYHWGDFFAEIRMDPEAWAYAFGRFSFYVSEVKLSWVDMFYSFLYQMGYEIVPISHNVDVDTFFGREMNRSYVQEESDPWLLHVDVYVNENPLDEELKGKSLHDFIHPSRSFFKIISDTARQLDLHGTNNTWKPFFYPASIHGYLFYDFPTYFSFIDVETEREIIQELLEKQNYQEAREEVAELFAKVIRDVNHERKSDIVESFFDIRQEEKEEKEFHDTIQKMKEGSCLRRYY